MTSAPKCLCEMSLEEEKNYVRYLFKSLYNPRVDLIKVSGNFATLFQQSQNSTLHRRFLW